MIELNNANTKRLLISNANREQCLLVGPIEDAKKVTL